MDGRVSIVGCENYAPETVERAMDALFAPLDALGWVKPGMKIAVKANLVVAHGPEKAATPHPEIVCALCRRLTERGAEVVVGDSPGGPYRKPFLDTVYRATGMTQVTRTGARLNDDFGETEVTVPEGKTLRSFWCCDYLLKADAIIDLCKLKTHALMGYTGACKNMFGAITGTHKTEFHYRFPTHEAFASMLVDLCGYLKPRLSICDGVLAMEGNGNFRPQSIDVSPITILVGFAELTLNLTNTTVRDSLCNTQETSFYPALTPHDVVCVGGNNLLSGKRNGFPSSRKNNVGG